MNPKVSQWHTLPDTGWKNLIGQWPGSNSSVKKTAHTEAAGKGILTKPRTKCKIPWESIAVRKKTR